MWKMIGWLAKTVAAGLIISFLSIWTTGYIVNSYVETILKQYNLPLEIQPFALSGVWGKMWGADPAETVEEKQPVESEAIDLGKGQSGKEETPPVAIDAFSDDVIPPLTDMGIGSGTKADGGLTTGTEEEGAGLDEGQVPSLNGTETAVTTDELTGMKEQMSEADKEQLFGMLMSKLPQEAWQSISAFMENGLTDEELISVQQIMAQYMDKEEYGKMLEILKKY